MYLVISLATLFLGFQFWALRGYVDFMDTHPEVEKRLIDSALRQSC